MSGDDIILEDQITLYYVNNWIQIPLKILKVPDHCHKKKVERTFSLRTIQTVCISLRNFHHRDKKHARWKRLL